MVDRVTAWQCIGCGRIEAPQQCIGICRDRKVEFVEAGDYDAALARMEALAAVVSQIAHTKPRPGECERTWDALQARARQALETVRQ